MKPLHSSQKHLSEIQKLEMFLSNMHIVSPNLKLHYAVFGRREYGHPAEYIEWES